MSLRVEVVVEGLEAPWAIAFAPDGRLFITERPGRVRVLKEGRLVPEPWMAFEGLEGLGEGGLLGLALGPDFPRTGFAYLYHTYRAGGRLFNRLLRVREQDGKGVVGRVLLDRIPGAIIHDGGRLAVGPDGKLYVTTGDAAQPPLAQDLSSLAGKVLRLELDGAVPADNPFPGSPVYSFGHRNPQGLAWHPDTGALYITEHGPVAHDEVNTLRPGGNYGWPAVIGLARDPRFLDPLVESGRETWAPAGAAFVTQGPWRGSLLFTALRGHGLRLLRLSPDGARALGIEEYLGEYGRLRDVAEGPDGALYVLTSNRDGRGFPRPGDDKLLRLIVQAAP